VRTKAISCLSLLILITMVTVLTAAANPAATFTASLEITGGNRYKALRLTPEVYYSANSDLSDLLLRDSGGEPVPYFIHTGYQTDSTSRETHAMALINDYVKDDRFYFDYQVAVPPAGDVIASSIVFSTHANNFAKEVTLYGSYDNQHWQYVQADRLYSIDDRAKLSISFTQPQKYTYYRLELANNLEQISFETVTLVYDVASTEEEYFVESIRPGFTTRSHDKKTDILIEGLQNLRLCDVTIYSDSMFMRTAITPYGDRKEIYSLVFDGVPYADTTMDLHRDTPQDAVYTITIDDGDDKPIHIETITVQYYADEIVFEGVAGESYTLEFGRDPAKTAPVYDIARYGTEILKGEIDSVTMGEIIYTGAASAPERDYRTVFNIVIVVVALLLGAVILRKLRRKGEETE